MRKNKPRIEPYSGYRCGSVACYGYGKTPKSAYKSWQGIKSGRSARRKKLEAILGDGKLGELRVTQLKMELDFANDSVGNLKGCIKNLESKLAQADRRVRDLENALESEGNNLNKQINARLAADGAIADFLSRHCRDVATREMQWVAAEISKRYKEREGGVWRK